MNRLRTGKIGLGILFASLAFAGCSSGDTTTGEGSEESASETAFTRPPGVYEVLPVSEDKVLAGNLVNAGRLDLGGQLQEIATTGLVAVPGSSQRCRLTAGMHRFLEQLDFNKRKLRGALVYSGAGGFHADTKSVASPPVSEGCLAHAMDITELDGKRIIISDLEKAESAITAEWKVGGVAPLDGDKAADVIWRNVTTGEIAVWYMNGVTEPYEEYLAPTQPSESTSLLRMALDLDGDGAPDLLWRENTAGGKGELPVRFLGDRTSTRGFGQLFPNVPDLEWKLPGAFY